MEGLAPICLFTYNRLFETKQTIEALQKNYLASNSDLFIFSDGAKKSKDEPNIKKVRKYLKTVSGFKTVSVFESANNKGLAKSITSGVENIFERYDRIIVLEDDLITTPNFLNFMNQALDYYDDNLQVQTVNGFSLKLDNGNYFETRPFPWGWATWKNRWSPEIFDKNRLQEIISNDNTILKKFKASCGDDIVKMLLGSLSGVNNSWYVRWTFDHFMKGTIALYPKKSLVYNIGFGVDGTHCNNGINPYIYILDTNHQTSFEFSDDVTISEKGHRKFLKYFTRRHKILIRMGLLVHKEGRNQVINEIKQRFHA